MFSDPTLVPSPRHVCGTQLTVLDRGLTGVGFITGFARTPETKLYEPPISTRWGKVLARLNRCTGADFVVYVDDGHLTAVEGCTFGGEPWPDEITHFELRDLPGR